MIGAAISAIIIGACLAGCACVRSHWSVHVVAISALVLVGMVVMLIRARAFEKELTQEHNLMQLFFAFIPPLIILLGITMKVTRNWLLAKIS